MGRLSGAEKRDRVKSQVWEQESQDREQSTWVRAAFLGPRQALREAKCSLREVGLSPTTKTVVQMLSQRLPGSPQIALCQLNIF